MEVLGAGAQRTEVCGNISLSPWSMWRLPAPDNLQALRLRQREPFWKEHRETLKPRTTLQSVAKNIIKIPNALGLE